MAGRRRRRAAASPPTTSTFARPAPRRRARRASGPRCCATPRKVSTPLPREVRAPLRVPGDRDRPRGQPPLGHRQRPADPGRRPGPQPDPLLARAGSALQRKGAWGRTVVRSSQREATAKLRFRGRRVALIGRRLPKGGRLRVTIDGGQRTISPARAARGTAACCSPRRRLRRRAARVRLTAVGGGPVELDAVAARRDPALGSARGGRSGAGHRGRAAGSAEPSASTAKAAPVVEHMVVFRDGSHRAEASQHRGVLVRVGQPALRVGHRHAARRAVRRGRAAASALRDFGSCSRRAATPPACSCPPSAPTATAATTAGSTRWAEAGHGRRRRPHGPVRARQATRRPAVTWFYCRRERGGQLPAHAGAVHLAAGRWPCGCGCVLRRPGRGSARPEWRSARRPRVQTTDAERLATFAMPPGGTSSRATRAGDVRTYPPPG